MFHLVNGRPRGYCKRCHNIKSRYNLNHYELEEILISQDYKCKICSAPLTKDGPIKMHIDHCHEHMYVRGVLCSNCNHGIGQFKHDPNIVMQAVNYLFNIKENIVHVITNNKKLKES